jgi:hypothetical protein
VKKRLFHRLSAALGLVAMLSAISFAPAMTSAALAMELGSPVVAAAQEQMPCHKPAKPCPDCPQKACPDMSVCVAKCFQPLTPIAEVSLRGSVSASVLLPASSQVPAKSRIPPLLRPPSV